MKAVRTFLVALLLGWMLPAFTLPASALVAVPQLSGRVVDQTGTLSSGNIAQLTESLADFERRKGSQIVVLIVPTTDGEAIEQFSLRVAEAWKIGRKKVDDGALLVIAKNDRRLRIEVGYGLEGALTDVTSKRIIDEVITPKFKSGDFAGGISDGVVRMIRVIYGEKLPEPEQPHWDGQGMFGHLDALNPFLIFIVFIVSSALRAMLGRLLGALGAGGFVTALAWFLWGDFGAALALGVFVAMITVFVGVVTSGTGGSGWSGGSSSSSSDWSSSSSSSSDSGSFSGGGGSFGGGGASGSW
jgi:uncharacterized protein